MTLAMWGAVLAYIQYELTSNRRWLITAGVLAGIAIAFKLPGGIILPLLFLAIGSRAGSWRYPGRTIKELAVLGLVTVATLTIVAPEWMVNIASNAGYFTSAATEEPSDDGIVNHDVKKAFRLLTTQRSSGWSGNLRTLLQLHNLVLTIAALVGLALGLMRRHRWSIIWGVIIIVFIAIMSASNRGQPEHYLLPIVPCLWLLSSHSIMTISRRRTWVNAGALACVAALPVTALARQNYEWTQLDTRVVAKQWIEKNIPSGAKILMDGYQNRFTPSPPLTPNKSVVLRQIAGIASEPTRFRGVSQRTLKLYAEAMESVPGPSYDLHSTVWGLAVEEPSNYVHRCFDYIITSSLITNRYTQEINERRFPNSVKFYEELDSVPYLRKIYAVEPVPWQRGGPTITVYEVLSSCTAVQKQQAALTGDNSVQRMSH
jgi:hypothetical protein